jgi:hypothetical protein
MRPRVNVEFWVVIDAIGFLDIQESETISEKAVDISIWQSFENKRLQREIAISPLPKYVSY